MKTMSPQTRRTAERKPATTRPVAPIQQPTTSASPRAQLGSAPATAMKSAAGASFKAKGAPKLPPGPTVRMPKK